MATVKIDLNKLTGILSDALESTTEFAAQENFEAIKAWEYAWPNSTERQVGLFSGSFVAAGLRDIVDTGRLLSDTDYRMIGKFKGELAWDPVDPDSGEHYALTTHEGSGDESIFARRWTKVAADRNDGFLPKFGQELRKRL